jgi:anti-sigma B factor antagonist
MELTKTGYVASPPDSMAYASAFSCTCLEQGASTVVVAVGEVDLASSGRLRQALNDALSGSASVIVDCALITFCNSCGIETLLRAQRSASDAGAYFALASVPDCLDRVLKLAGLSGVLPTFATVAAARDQA